MATQKHSLIAIRLLCCFYLVTQAAVAQTCPPVATGCTNPGFTEIQRGSSVLKHAQIQVLYWGTAWAGTQASYASQITGALQDMVNGPYFWALNQYSDVSLPRLIPFTDMVTGSDPGTYPTFSEASLTTMVRGEMTAGRIPKPHAGLDMLYVVVVPPGWHSAADSSIVGRHFYDSYNGTQYYVAWVTTAATLTSAYSTTQNFGHEVAEAITDANPNNGWTGNDQHTMEIADPCRDCNYNVNGCAGGGYTVQALWSNVQARCIYPKAWRGVAYYTGSGNWQQLYVGEVRQVYASYFGLIATSNSDPSELWEWAPNIQDIGPASNGLPFGSMFAIDGNDNVYAISYDQKNVSQTNLGGSGTLLWTNIVNNGATSVYAGSPNGVMITWPGNNHVWVKTSTTSWTDVGNGGLTSGLAIGEDGLYQVSLDHSSISFMHVIGTFNTVVTGTVADILGSSSLIVYTSYSDESIWTYGEGTHKNGSVIPYMLGVAQVASNCTDNRPTLYGLTASNPPERVTQSSNVSATLPSWSQHVTSGIGRLITGGCGLMAAYDPGCSTVPNETCQ